MSARGSPRRRLTFINRLFDDIFADSLRRMGSAGKLCSSDSSSKQDLQLFGRPITNFARSRCKGMKEGAQVKRELSCERRSCITRYYSPTVSHSQPHQARRGTAASGFIQCLAPGTLMGASTPPSPPPGACHFASLDPAVIK